MDIPSEAASNGLSGLGGMGASRKARAHRPLCAIIENNKCAAGADNNKQEKQHNETLHSRPPIFRASREMVRR